MRLPRLSSVAVGRPGGVGRWGTSAAGQPFAARWGRAPSSGVRIRLVLASAAAVSMLTGCGSGGGESPNDQAFLGEVHGAAPDIGQYRSDAQLIRLGHVVCDDFAAGASYEEVADRLSIDSGSDTLPTADLGAVITAAADNYCPEYRSDVS